MEKYIPLQPGSDEDGQIDQTSSLLQHEIDTREGDSAILMQWTHKRRGSLLYVILQGSVLVSTALIFFASGWVLHTPSTTTSSAWNDVTEAIRYQPQQFEPHFVGPPSEYQGDPSPELDAKWTEIAKLRNFAIDRETIVRANKTKANVQFPNTSTYQAGMEAFHQLHCLNYIRMYAERPYYKNVDHDMVRESDQDSKNHKDHCVDVLRQRLMCMPDLQIYTYHWESNHDLPFADLRTNHQCIDWGNFQSWADKRAFSSPPLHRPAGAETLTEEDKWGR